MSACNAILKRPVASGIFPFTNFSQRILARLFVMSEDRAEESQCCIDY